MTREGIEVADTGEIKFYHGDKVGDPIKFTLRGDVSRDEFLRRAIADPEVEGFEVIWDAAATHTEGERDR